MLNLFLQGARLKTLPAAVAPVTVGTGLAYFEDAGAIWMAALCLVVALGMQLGTNFVNDYADGKRGTDSEARVGPERLVGSGLATVKQVKLMAAGSFAVACIAGLVLAASVGWELIIVGVVAVIAGWAYTGGPNPYGYMGLGELFVFIFFGLVATVGTYYTQAEEITDTSVLLGASMGFLATALLIANNLRDIETDRAAGKNTLAVRIGDTNTRLLLVICILGSSIAMVASTAQTTGWLLIAVGSHLIGLLVANSVLLKKASGADLIATLEVIGRLQLIVASVAATVLLIA